MSEDLPTPSMNFQGQLGPMKANKKFMLFVQEIA